MRRAIALALALVVAGATPGLAHVTVDPVEVRTELIAAGGDGYDTDDTEDDAAYGDAKGEDGTEPATFLALLIAGMATMAAVAALIFATKRVPA